MAKSSKSSGSKGIVGKVASAVSKAASKVASTVAKNSASKSTSSSKSTKAATNKPTTSTSKKSSLISTSPKQALANARTAAAAVKQASTSAAKSNASGKTGSTTSTKSSGGTKSAVTGGGSVAGMAAQPSTKSTGSYYYGGGSKSSSASSSPSAAVQSSGGSTTTVSSTGQGKKLAGSRNTGLKQTETTFDDLTGEVTGIAENDLGATSQMTDEEKNAGLTGSKNDEDETSGFDELTGNVQPKDKPYTDPETGFTFRNQDEYLKRWNKNQDRIDAHEARNEAKAAAAAQAAQINSSSTKKSEAAAPVAFNQWGQHHAQGDAMNGSKTNPNTNTYQSTMNALSRLGLKSTAATEGQPLSPLVTNGNANNNGYNNPNSIVDNYMSKFDNIEQGGVAGDIAANAAQTYTDFIKQLQNYAQRNGMGQDEYNNLLNKVRGHSIRKSLAGNRR